MLDRVYSAAYRAWDVAPSSVYVTADAAPPALFRSAGVWAILCVMPGLLPRATTCGHGGTMPHLQAAHATQSKGKCRCLPLDKPANKHSCHLATTSTSGGPHAPQQSSPITITQQCDCQSCSNSWTPMLPHLKTLCCCTIISQRTLSCDSINQRPDPETRCTDSAHNTVSSPALLPPEPVPVEDRAPCALIGTLITPQKHRVLYPSHPAACCHMPCPASLSCAWQRNTSTTGRPALPSQPHAAAGAGPPACHI